MVNATSDSERRMMAQTIMVGWCLLVCIDALYLRAQGTGLIHAAFSVLHDPAITLTYLVLIPAAIYTLSVVLPVDLIQRTIKRQRWPILGIALVICGFALWWNAQETMIRFCTGMPFPEDIGDPAARSRLSDVQSNYLAAFVANSDEDVLAARQDYFVALAQSRTGDCAQLSDFCRLASLRAKWSFGLGNVPALLLAGIIWLLVLHAITHTRVERELTEGFAVIAAAFSLYPLFSYYSDWYISFGDTIADRPMATVMGIVCSSLTLFVLPPTHLPTPLWQRLAQTLALTGLISNVLCVVRPRGFVHVADHFAVLSLAVVLFAELLISAWIIVMAKLFADSLEEPKRSNPNLSSKFFKRPSR